MIQQLHGVDAVMCRPLMPTSIHHDMEMNQLDTDWMDIAVCKCHTFVVMLCLLIIRSTSAFGNFSTDTGCKDCSHFGGVDRQSRTGLIFSY